MVLQFNPPPGWSAPSGKGWVPPQGWEPDPSWPPPPPNWPFWIEAAETPPSVGVSDAASAPVWQAGAQNAAWQAPGTEQPTLQQPVTTMVPQARRAGGTTGSRSRKPIIIAAVVVVLLALGGGGWWAVDATNKSVYSADKVAQAYLTALQSGDFAKASAIAAPKVAEGTSDALLDAKFGGSSPARIADVKVVSTTVAGDSATIDATYSLAGESYYLTLKAVRDGRQMLVFDKWRLEPPALATVSLNKPGTLKTTVNGLAFTLGADKVVYALLPGTYTFESESTTYLSGDKHTVTVWFADAQATSQSLTFTTTATDALTSEVRAQVAAKMTQCAASTTAVLSAPENGCPFYILPGSSAAPNEALGDIAPNTMRWSVATQPEISLIVGSDATISFITTTPGKRTYTAGSKRPGYTWSGFGEIVVSGHVQITGDQVSLTYD